MISISLEIPDLESLLDELMAGMIQEIVENSGHKMKALHARSRIRSLPGQPPGVDSGSLLASINQTFDASLLQGEISLNDYGLMLEEGTSKMAPRAWIMPGIEEALQVI